MGGRVRRWQATTWQGTARKNFSNYVHFVAKNLGYSTTLYFLVNLSDLVWTSSRIMGEPRFARRRLISGVTYTSQQT